MKHLLLPLVLCLLTGPLMAEADKKVFSDEDCESLVDDMDDLDFVDAIDCDDDNTPEVLKSLSSYLNGGSKKDVIVTYEALPADDSTLQSVAVGPVTAEAAAESANPHTGTSFVIREQYSLQLGARVPGLTTAIQTLHAEMAQYCPMGWEKEREWTRPAEDGSFLLHYLFTCQE